MRAPSPEALRRPARSWLKIWVFTAGPLFGICEEKLLKISSTHEWLRHISYSALYHTWWIRYLWVSNECIANNCRTWWAVAFSMPRYIQIYQMLNFSKATHHPFKFQRIPYPIRLEINAWSSPSWPILPVQFTRQRRNAWWYRPLSAY